MIVTFSKDRSERNRSPESRRQGRVDTGRPGCSVPKKQNPAQRDRWVLQQLSGVEGLQLRLTARDVHPQPLPTE